MTGIEIDVLVDLAPIRANAAHDVCDPEEDCRALTHHCLLLEGGEHFLWSIFRKSQTLQCMFHRHKLIKVCGHIFYILQIQQGCQRMERRCRWDIAQRAPSFCDHLDALRAP